MGLTQAQGDTPLANAVPSRLGQQNQAGDTDAIFLEVMAGLVLNVFDTKQVTMDRVTTKHISHGKTAQFPMIFNTTASYHTAGAEIVGTPISMNKKNIAIEDLLIADVFVDVLDEAKNHFETQQEYAHQLGEALANSADSNNLRAVFKGGKAAHLIDTTGDRDGTAIQVAGLSVTASLMKAAIYDAAQTLDEKDVPEENRTAALLPLAWYLLLEDGEFLEREFGGEGSKSRGIFSVAANIEVVKSNNIPTNDESSPPANVPTVLSSEDFREYIGGVWHTSGLGVVKLLDLMTEVGYDMRRQGTLLLAKYAIGQDWIRPETIVSFEDTDIVA